jgi:hypothetical protein
MNHDLLKASFEEFQKSHTDLVQEKYAGILETCTSLSPIIDDLSSSQLKSLLKSTLSYPADEVTEFSDQKVEDLYNISKSLFTDKAEVISILMALQDITESNYNEIKQRLLSLTKEEQDEQK